MELMTVKEDVSKSRNINKPKWFALKDYLMKELKAGHYKPGDILPSENKLSHLVGIARNTVRQAIGELEKEGLVERVRGSGTFVKNIQETEISRKTFLDAYSLIIPEIRRTLYPSLVKGFDNQSRSNYHQVLICNTDYDINKQGDIILQIVDKGIAGVAMVPPTFVLTPTHHIRQLQSNDIPVVFCHRRVPDISAPLVSWDWEEVGRLAGGAFIKHGHREIMFVGVYQYEITEAYARGLTKVMEDAGLTLRNDRLLYGTRKTEPNGDEIKDKMILNALRAPDRPTAVFCSDDNEAERVFWLAHEDGIKVPQELSIIGFGDQRRDSVFQKKLVSVTIDEFEVGVKAAEVLGQMCSGNRPMNSNDRIMINLEIMGKDTLGPGPHLYCVD